MGDIIVTINGSYESHEIKEGCEYIDPESGVFYVIIKFSCIKQVVKLSIFREDVFLLDKMALCKIEPMSKIEIKGRVYGVRPNVISMYPESVKINGEKFIYSNVVYST